MPHEQTSSGSSSNDGSEDELRASKLGTRAHWDEVYAEELSNYIEHGDEGEIWFGRDTMERVVKWSADLIRRQWGVEALKVSILDVGTGNGTMLVGLGAQGFTNLCGNDYSEPSIRLARFVLDKSGLQHAKLQVADLTDPDAFHEAASSVDVITDKGTFDAIGLSGTPGSRAVYQESVWRLLKDNGFLIITSCNSTVDELTSQFCGEPTSKSSLSWTMFDFVKTHPKFRFGGVEGSKVATVAFQKRSRMPQAGRTG